MTGSGIYRIFKCFRTWNANDIKKYNFRFFLNGRQITSINSVFFSQNHITGFILSSEKKANKSISGKKPSSQKNFSPAAGFFSRAFGADSFQLKYYTKTKKVLLKKIFRPSRGVGFRWWEERAAREEKKRHTNRKT